MASAVGIVIQVIWLTNSFSYKICKIKNCVEALNGCVSSYRVGNVKWMLHGNRFLPADVHLEGGVEVVIYHRLLVESRFP